MSLERTPSRDAAQRNREGAPPDHLQRQPVTVLQGIHDLVLFRAEYALATLLPCQERGKVAYGSLSNQLVRELALLDVRTKVRIQIRSRFDGRKVRLCTFQ